jgi:hypothetical protein
MECPFCNNNIEDDWHVLFNCNDSVLVRQAAELETIAVLLWMIWNNRNNKVWCAEHETGHGLGNKARQYLLDWKASQNFQHDNIN